MHDVHHAIVEVNVVIGVLVVHCELLVVRVVPVVVSDDAVVRRTLVLIAFSVAFVFVVAIFHRVLICIGSKVFTISFRNQEMTIVLFQISLRTEIRVWHLPDILLCCLLFHKECR